MKKIITAVIAIVMAITASAEFRWGINAGANFTTYGFKQELVEVDQSVGGGLGVIGELMFPGIGFGIDFGLNYNLHGSKLHLGEYKVWESDGYGIEQSYLHTIELPINLRFKYTNMNGVERYVAPFVYGGPIFSIIAGHNELEALEYSKGSIMLQCGLGAELFEKFQVSAGYYWGMSYETRTKKLDNYSSKSQGWKINLTYFF